MCCRCAHSKKHYRYTLGTMQYKPWMKFFETASPRLPDCSEYKTHRIRPETIVFCCVQINSNCVINLSQHQPLTGLGMPHNSVSNLDSQPGVLGERFFGPAHHHVGSEASHGDGCVQAAVEVIQGGQGHHVEGGGVMIVYLLWGKGRWSIATSVTARVLRNFHERKRNPFQKVFFEMQEKDWHLVPEKKKKWPMNKQLFTESEFMMLGKL